MKYDYRQRKKKGEGNLRRSKPGSGKRLKILKGNLKGKSTADATAIKWNLKRNQVFTSGGVGYW